MKLVVKYFAIIALLFVSTSCEDVVQVKLDEGSKLYVIDAFVDDMPGVQTIKVTYNSSYFSNTEAEGVAGATVVLKDLTVNKTWNFTYNANGKYVFTVTEADPMLIVGHQYELNVTINGDTYSSLNIVKRKASIAGILPITPEEAGAFGGSGPTDFFYCSLFAFDKTDANTDYYLVKTLRNDTLFFGPNDISVAIDGTGGPVNSSEFDSTLFTPPITFLNFIPFRSGNTCEAQIHSINRDTYFFFVQAVTQINNGGLFATTPENVKTNIVSPATAKIKAIGWFSTAGVSREKITVP